MPDTASTTRRRGRPPRISHAQITRAVLEIGTGQVTMRRVADHLGVSLPGLYHHVRNQQELLDLAATAALAAAPPPTYVGQSWAAFLTSYATYVRTALSTEPAILHQLLAGSIEVEGESAYVAHALDALVSQGLPPRAAMSAWTAVTELAMGSATETLREARRDPWTQRMRDHLLDQAEDAHPGLRALVADEHEPFREDRFAERLDLLIAGVAATSGLALRPRVADVMLTSPKVLASTSTAGDAAKVLSDPHVHAVPVVDSGTLVTLLERDDLDGAPTDAPAASMGRLRGRTTPPDVDLERTRNRMVRRGRRRLAVVGSDGGLLGLLCLKHHGGGFCTDADVRDRASSAAE